jgi:hypothetical protein
MTESFALLIFLLSLSALGFFVCCSFFGPGLDEVLPERATKNSAEDPSRKKSAKKAARKRKNSKKKTKRRRKS